MYLEPSTIFFLVLVAGGYALVTYARVHTWKQRAESITDTKAYRREIEAQMAKRNTELDRREGAIRAAGSDLDNREAHLARILDQTARAYPWAAQIYADVLEREANGLTRDLQAKRHPAFKAAEEVQAFKRSVREALQKAKYAEYKAHVYESTFPFLIDLFEGAPTSDLAVVDLAVEDEDPVRRFLTQAEYERLTPVERSQAALERYIQRRKSNWEIGRDYERYIGHLYEKDGWDVDYHGATRGLEDLGRDLIARRNGETLIIQCKYWSQWKDVHENTIFQLFGSLVDYAFERGILTEGADVFESMTTAKVAAVFISSTRISKRAALAAEALGIECRTNCPFDRDYPRIKCNVGRQEKLYHLPFDQQYDRIKIEAGKGEFYAATAAEAEAAGFRRVFRWRSGASID